MPDTLGEKCLPLAEELKKCHKENGRLKQLFYGMCNDLNVRLRRCAQEEYDAHVNRMVKKAAADHKEQQEYFNKIREAHKELKEEKKNRAQKE